MTKVFGSFFLLALLPLVAMGSQGVSGAYTCELDGETVTLRLSQDAAGNVSGSMSVEGIEFAVSGSRQGDGIEGVMEADDEMLFFAARLAGLELIVTLLDPGEGQGPAGGASETLVFRRLQDGKADARAESSPPAGAKAKAPASAGKVVINGVVLSESQVAELAQIYRIQPIPGNYWYDARSGLYGVVGFPAYGFMLAGHRFGKLTPEASSGDSGVFVNGRQLPQAEWLVWSQLLGYMIQPGRYWLDENGNAGTEGNPTPTENLYLAAQRNAYSGGGAGGAGGGDNFWSSRFSAGNYDSGNQRGYVSVPGHGPVGYGF